jgi:hypothetical protein
VEWFVTQKACIEDDLHQYFFAFQFSADCDGVREGRPVRLVEFHAVPSVFLLAFPLGLPWHWTWLHVPNVGCVFGVGAVAGERARSGELNWTASVISVHESGGIRQCLLFSCNFRDHGRLLQ